MFAASACALAPPDRRPATADVPGHPPNAHSIALYQFVGSLQCGLHGEGVVGLLEVAFRNPVLRHERRLDALGFRRVVRVGGNQWIAVDVNFLEDLAVQLIQFAHAVQRVVQPRQGTMACVPHHMNARKADVGRLGLLPRFDQGVDRIAVRAGVPEKLQHLDLPGGDRRRLSRYDPRVVDTFLPQRRPTQRGGGCRGCRGRNRRGDRRQQRVVRAAVSGYVLDGLGTVFIHASELRRQVSRLLSGFLLTGGLRSRRRRGGCNTGGRALIRGLLFAASGQRERQSGAQGQLSKAHGQRRPCKYDARLRMSSGDRRLAMVCMMPFGPVGRAPEA